MGADVYAPRGRTLNRIRGSHKTRCWACAMRLIAADPACRKQSGVQAADQ